MTLIYIVAGAFLVPLCLALYERVVAAAAEARPAALLATAFGLIWAALLVGSGLVHNVGLGETVKLYGENPGQAALFWRMIETVHAGIGASIEIPGGLWTLLIAAAALRAGAFPKALNLFAIPVGAAGILSIVPPLAVIAVPLFALGQIVWWICIGVLMLRRPAAG